MFTTKLYLFATGENQFAPGSCRRRGWLARWFGYDGFLAGIVYDDGDTSVWIVGG